MFSENECVFLPGIKRKNETGKLSENSVRLGPDRFTPGGSRLSPPAGPPRPAQLATATTIQYGTPGAAGRRAGLAEYAPSKPCHTILRFIPRLDGGAAPFAHRATRGGNLDHVGCVD